MLWRIDDELFGSRNGLFEVDSNDREIEYRAQTIDGGAGKKNEEIFRQRLVGGRLDVATPSPRRSVPRADHDNQTHDLHLSNIGVKLCTIDCEICLIGL